VKSKRFYVTAEVALTRILNATIAGGGALGADFSLNQVWEEILQCVHWAATAEAVSSRVHDDRVRRLKRIISAAQVIQQEMAALDDWGPKNIDKIWDLERFAEERLEWAEYYRNMIIKGPVGARVLSFNTLSAVVGQLAVPFERAFPASPKYTTVDSETDGPFIRFVEQTFCEFGITKDGNQPYMRRSIAAALNEFKKYTNRKQDGKLPAANAFPS
jgi:hypothetical protein